MNSGTASRREWNPPLPGAASKRPSEDSGESSREKRHASMTASAEDVSLTDERSPLHRAAQERDVKRVRELIERGADTRLRDRWGQTPLHGALFLREEAVAELLVEADCSNDVQDVFGNTPLNIAAGEGRVKIIRKLLAGGSRTRVQNERGWTPLHSALYFTHEAAAELLAEADPANDIQDKCGYTPLHLAAEKEFQGTARKLVQSGTNPHVKWNREEYPIQLAFRHGRDKAIPKMILSLYALQGIAIDQEELQLRKKNLRFCIEEISRCSAEIRLMKRTRVPASSISHHHLVTRHAGRVASRLRTGDVRILSHRDRALRKFPVYADLIASKLRMAEERRVRMDRCMECFFFLSPPLPMSCVDVVLLCLSDGDMENFVRAFRLRSRECRSGCSRR